MAKVTVAALARRARVPIGLGVLAVLLAGGAFWAWSVSGQRDQRVAVAIAGGNPANAPALIRRYGCGGCHTVPSVSGADGKVGPPLDHLRQRVYIGGVLLNSPDNLVRWTMSPETFSPRSAMPAPGLTEAEARDIAAFLYAH